MTRNNYIYTEDIHNKSAAEQVLPFIIEMIQPKSMLDLGCGIGTWLSVAQQLGIEDFVGIDGIYAKNNLLQIPESKFLSWDLSEPLDLKRKFDIALCLEVAEHLQDSNAELLIDILTIHSDIILFSAAIPGQGGQNHINEQWPSYFENFFKKRSYVGYDILRPKFWNNSKIEWWYKQNMILYATQNNKVFNGILPSDPVLSLVHPDLLMIKNNKVDHLNSIIFDDAAYPKFFPTIKRLIKSIVKPVFLKRQ